MEEFGRRLPAELCVWMNKAQGCLVRIWKKVVG
jgi:hypothetical protein